MNTFLEILRHNWKAKLICLLMAWLLWLLLRDALHLNRKIPNEIHPNQVQVTHPNPWGIL